MSHEGRKHRHTRLERADRQNQQDIEDVRRRQARVFARLRVLEAAVMKEKDERDSSGH